MKHKGDRVPTSRMEWVGRAFLCAVPLGFIGASIAGHVLLAMVILTSVGAYAQWAVWVGRRRFAAAAAVARPADTTTTSSRPAPAPRNDLATRPPEAARP